MNRVAPRSARSTLPSAPGPRHAPGGEREGLGQPLPADHRGPPRDARGSRNATTRLPPSIDDRRARAPHRGAGLPLRLRPRRRRRRQLGARRSGRRRPPGRAPAACLRPGPLPGRAAAAALAARPLAEPLARLAWRSGSAFRRSRPATPTPTSARASRSRTRWWRCGSGRRWTRPRRLRRGNSASTLLACEGAPQEHPEAMGGALPRPPRGGRRDGAARRAPALRPHAGARLQLSRRGGRGRGPPPG